MLHICHVRHTDVCRLGRLERHGESILEHYPADDCRRRSALIHLRPPHMVLILSDGHDILMGKLRIRQDTEGVQIHRGGKCMPNEVQVVFTGMSDATETL